MLVKGGKGVNLLSKMAIAALSENQSADITHVSETTVSIHVYSLGYLHRCVEII